MWSAPDRRKRRVWPSSEERSALKSESETDEARAAVRELIWGLGNSILYQPCVSPNWDTALAAISDLRSLSIARCFGCVA